MSDGKYIDYAIAQVLLSHWLIYHRLKVVDLYSLTPMEYGK